MLSESTDHNKNTYVSSKWPGRRTPSPSGEAADSWDSSLPVPQLSVGSAAAVVSAVAILCFINSLNGQFVFDDSEAIVNNRDLGPETPWTNAFYNDFWGTKLTHNTSHKSYRPLTVLSFRLNHVISNGLNPWGFHLTNILLHAVVSVLMLPAFSVLLAEGATVYVSKSAFLCALLFAVHPVHTESVAGVVGRADLLCALFFFLAFLAYARACKPGLDNYAPCCFSLPLVLLSMTLCAVSMLCKEQGITAIGLCSAYDVIVVCRVDFAELLGLNVVFNQTESSHRSWHRSRSPEPPCRDWLKPLVLRHLVLLGSGLLMITTRWHIMGSAPPTFQQVDNPASFAKTFYERTINYNYVYALNAWLLVAPVWLCFDWSMGCVPLIRSALDVRILVVLVFWLALGSLLILALFRPSSRDRKCLTMALALLIVPFLPASNLFFRVGFVIAERVLYISSAGYCLLVVLGLRKLCSVIENPKTIQVSLVILVITFAARCTQRSGEWRSEEVLFRSGSKVCPLNAKVHYNIAKNAADAGNRYLAIQEYEHAIRLNPLYDQAMNNLANILKDQGQLEQAEQLLRKAITLRHDYAAAWMNLGIVQSSLKKHNDAERSYQMAIYHRRQYPDCYYNLGNLYLEQQRYEEAFRAWRNATRLKPTHLVSWNNMIIMLDSTGDLERAEHVALEGLRVLPHEPSLHFNLANALGKAGRYDESQRHFLEAIRLNTYNPTYHVNLGVLYHRWKKYRKAEEAYRKALQLSPEMKSARENLALLLNTVAKNELLTT